MAHKVNREQSVAERNKKIAEMDIEELKKYLCMKNFQKPEKCVDCASIAGCAAGQRAVVLLSEKARREQESTGKTELADIRTRFIAACQQEKMVDWLMDQDKISRMAARAKLKYWASKHQDIAVKYDFDQRLEGESKRHIATEWIAMNAKEKSSEAKKRYLEAKDKDDPIQYLMDKYGLTRKQATKAMQNYRHRYGAHEEKTMEEKTADQTDEISVEDFLNEMKAEQVDEPDNKQEPEPQESNQISESDRIVFEAFAAKYRELGMERRRIHAQIEELKKQEEKLERDQKALEAAGIVFNHSDIVKRMKEKAS